MDWRIIYPATRDAVKIIGSADSREAEHRCHTQFVPAYGLALLLLKIAMLNVE
jgi:hypothetical protein